MKTYLFERKFYKTDKRKSMDIEVRRSVGIERVRQLCDEAFADPLTNWIYVEEECSGPCSHAWHGGVANAR